MRLKLFFCLIFSFGLAHVFAQKGFVRGTVFDRATGEYLPGVTVVVEGTTSGTITDLDGKFNLPLEPGSYNLRISFISYEVINLAEVEVQPGEVTLIDDLGLEEATIALNEVVVTGRAIRNTETAMLSLKRKSVNLLDGISAASLKKIGDSDAASSMKRVPGVSVADGKYVFVRGLGDRYTKTTLNGVDIPGLDPDKNSLQMDIFPTSIIDNIIVHKSFSADLPADFTGGIIDIEIVQFPEEQTGKVNFSGGYNPGSHFNNDFLTYTGSSTDFLGIDNGTRKLPSDNIPEFAEFIGDPDGETAMEHLSILRSLDPEMAGKQKTSFMDYSLGLSYGNQKSLAKYTLGYNFALSYKNNTDYYDNAIDGKFNRNPDAAIYELDRGLYKTGRYGQNNVLLSGIAGFALKTQKSKIRLNILHLQNGEKKAGKYEFYSSDKGSVFNAIEHGLDWTERSLSNVLIDGKHSLSDTKWEIIWKVSPTYSRLDNPDTRFSRYEIIGSNNDIQEYRIGTEVGFPERIWRFLDEINAVNLVHITRDFKFNNQNAKLKFGGAYTYKYRHYEILKYSLNVREGTSELPPFTGNANELLTDNYIWPYNDDISTGITLENNINKSNEYNANVNYIAGYVSIEINLTQKLKSTAGVRLESYKQRYTGQNQTGTKILNNDVVLDDLNLFPSINLIYNFSDNQNLRFSYTNTIARPSLKELSYAEIVDPIESNTFIGGLHAVDNWDGNLISTSINNYDLRWELFFNSGQMISLSGFYKTLNDPIELVQMAGTSKPTFQPRNVGKGEILGVEFEIRKNLGFITPGMEPFMLSGNVTVTQSRIKLSNVEYNSRVFHAREGQVIDEYRDMAGQAPVIVNGGFSYDGATNGFFSRLEAGIYYNVQGKTLDIVGPSSTADVYTMPFHSLNFNSSIKFGSEEQMSLGLKVTNILNYKKESVYSAYKATDQIYKSREPGTTFSFSFSYRFL